MTRRYADDDLDAGLDRPTRSFRIFHEMIFVPTETRGRRRYGGLIVDQRAYLKARLRL